MPIEITMPQLSDTMSEGTVVAWKKKEGEAVRSGEEIADVETDKATMPMEAFEDGVLAAIVVGEGDKVEVGQVLAVLAGKGEDAAAIKKQYAGRRPAAAPAAKAPAAAAASEAETAAPAPAPTPSPAPEPGRAAGERVVVSPLARRIAADLGVDLATVRGSGPNGRIVQKDIEEAAARAKAPAPAAPAAKAVAPAAPLPARVLTGQKQVIPLTKIRATIATRLQQSKQQLPHFYEMVDIDCGKVLDLRAKLNAAFEKEGVRLSLADFIAKALAVALQQHPVVNSTFDGQQITMHGDVNLGMAVALPGGLIVPVLRGVNQMGLKEIRQRTSDLIERARQQKLKQDELTGGTFTISNLGNYGIREFTAIINPPEVAILAIGTAEKRPVCIGDQIVARTMMTVTLSADHRVIDGAAAAEFLRTFKNLMEEPGLMLV
jgi:pyruvate dehydrogenase E2 component (dihydrolipoamide acetyltransferase)